MKSKTSKHGLKRMTALLLAVVLCVGMVPTAFAAQQDSYHDPAEHWQEANNRTNELDANATIVWNYIGELVFNMLVLVGAIKMSDRLVRELMGLG